MLSNELAELAGVTVRTLRHYHQIGVLPEPPRSSAGYRRYDVSHLVQLLRITRMAALGVPLSVLPQVLEDEAALEDLLDELDRQAAAEIEQLTARRTSIAALRRTGTPPDLAPEFSEQRTARAQGPAEMAGHEHNQLVLLGSFLGPQDRTALADLLGEFDALGGEYPRLTERFYTLDSASSEEEISSFVDDFVALLELVLGRLPLPPSIDPQSSALLEELNEQSLGPVQLWVLRRIQQRLTPSDAQ